MPKEDAASGYPSGIPKISLPIPELLSIYYLFNFFYFFNNSIKTYKKYVQGFYGLLSMTSGMFTYHYICIILCFKPVSSIWTRLNHGIIVTLGTPRVILQGNYRANMYFLLLMYVICITSGMFTCNYICIICCLKACFKHLSHIICRSVEDMQNFRLPAKFHCIPYARPYNLRFVYFLLTFWISFMHCDLWPYVWLVFKSGF